jgi:hypothetical protein
MKKLSTILTFVIILFSFACDGSKENPINPNLATVTFDANLFNSDLNQESEFFVMASKSDGSLIDYKPIDIGQTVTLSLSDYSENEFTFSIIDRSIEASGKSLSGLSYQGMPRGVEIIIKDPRSQTAEFVTLKAINFNQNNSSYLFSLPGHFIECFADGSLPLPSAKNNSPLYIVTRNVEGEDNGYLLTQTNYALGQEYDLSLNKIFNAFTSDPITISSDFDFAANYLYGRLANDAPEQAYWLSFSEARLSQNNLALKKPGSLFSSYSSYSTAYSNSLNYLSFSTDKSNDFEIPVYEILDFDAEPGIVNYSATSQDGFVGIAFGNFIDGVYLDWIVTNKVGLVKTARVPNIPSEITSFISGFSNNFWIWDETFYFTWPNAQLPLSDIVAFDMLGWMPYNVPTINTKFLDVYVGDPNNLRRKNSSDYISRWKENRFFQKPQGF